MNESTEGLRVSLYEAAMNAAIEGDDEWAGNYLRALAPLEPDDEEVAEVAINTAEMLVGDAIERGYLEVIEAVPCDGLEIDGEPVVVDVNAILEGAQA